MPSALTRFGANAVLNMIFGARAQVPGQFYVALLTQAPGEATTGELLSEPPPGTGYGRAAVMNNSATFGEAVGGFITTTSQISFGVATADWPVISHYALCDGTYSGGVYLYGSFNTPRKIKAGDKVTIPSGLLSLTASSLSTAVVGSF